MEYSLKPVDYDPFDEDPASPPEIPGFKLRPVSYDPFAEDKPELSMERLGGVLGEGFKDVARTTMHTLAGVTEYGLPEPVRAGVEAAIPALKATRLIPGAITKPVAEKFKESASSPLLETAPEYAGKSSGWIEDVVRAAPQMGSQVISTLAGGPLVGMGLMGLQIAGSTYESGIKEGKDPKNALFWGIANAIMQTPMEQLGVGKISRLWKPQKDVIAYLKKIGEAVGTEWFTEFLQQFPDSLSNIFATNPDKKALENIKTFAGKFKENLKEGAYQGTLTAPWALLGLGGIRRAKAPGIVEGGPEAAMPQPAEDQQAAMAKKLEADYLTGDVTIETIPEILKQVPKDSPIYQTGQRLIKDYQQLQAEQPIDLGVIPETIPKAIAKEEPVAEQAPAYVPEDMEKQEQLFDLNKGLLQERLAQEEQQGAEAIRRNEGSLFPGEEAGLGVPAPAGQLIQGAEQEALRPGPGEIGQNIQLPEPEKPGGTEQPITGTERPVAVPKPIKPTAEFVGWQERAGNKKPFALYNIIGGESHGSTVSWPKLAELGIEIPKTPPMPVKEKAKPVPKPKPPVKPTVVEQPQVEESFQELGRKSDEIQSKIDAKHDELEKQGLTFEEQNKHPELEALYKQRISYDAKAAQKGYSGAKGIIESELKGIPAKSTYASIDSILSEHYGLHDKPEGGYFMSQYTGKALNNPETVKNVAKDISKLILARERPNADFWETMESPISGFTKEGKGAIINEAIAKAERVHSKLKQFFMGDIAKQPQVEAKAPEGKEPLEMSEAEWSKAVSLQRRLANSSSPKVSERAKKELNRLQMGLKGTQSPVRGFVNPTYQDMMKQAKAPVEAGKAKEPWEMTRAEFVSNIELRDSANPSEKNRKNAFDKNTGKYITHGSFSEDWVKSHQEGDIKKQLHKNYIRISLAEGKPIPPEVLKDYPELQPKEVIPRGEETKEGQEGQREALLEKEPAPLQAVAPEGQVAKEPWEMSRENAVWGEYIPDGSSTDRALAGRLARWEKIKREAKNVNIESVEQAISIEKDRIARANAHRESVKQALTEGKPVPASVLADYPDLVKKPTQAPAEAVAPEKVRNVSALPSPEELKRWEKIDAYTRPKIEALDGEKLDALGKSVGVKRQGIDDIDYRNKILNNTHPDDLMDALAVAAPKEAKPAKVVLSKEEALKKKQEQFKANIEKGKQSQPRTIREWIKRKGGIDPNDPGWKGELSGLMWKLMGGREYRINLDLFRSKAKGGKEIDILVSMWNEEFPHRKIERGDELLAMIESNTPLERGSEEKEKSDIEEHGKKEQKDFFEKEEQTLNAATLLFGLTESPEKARMALEKKYGENWYWSRKFNEDLAKATEEADRRRLDEVRTKVAGYLEGQGYESSLASEVLNDDALLKKTLDLIDEETAIGNEIREQQSLFNKPKEEFKLKPSESTPLEQAALRGEKRAKLPEGEKIRAKIPEGKIRPPTSGRQDSFLNNKQKDLFTEGIDKLPDSDVPFVNIASTENQKVEFNEPKYTESTKTLPPRQWVRMATTGSLRAAGNVVSNSGDVASLLASIRRSPQEFFYTVATDKNGVILQIHKYIKGTSTAGPINSTEVAGSILRIPDVANAYLVHNHPAHSLDASLEDRMITMGISDALKSKNIATNSVIISGTGYRALDDKGDDLTFEEKIKPVSRKMLLPVVERKNLLRIKGYFNAKPVTNNIEALETALKYGGNQDGILFLDRRNRPTAFLPFVKGRTFRDTTADIIKLAEATNSSSIVIKNDTDSPNRRNYIDLLYRHEGIGPDLAIHDVIEKGKSRMQEGMPKRGVSGQFGPGTMSETLLRAEGEKAPMLAGDVNTPEFKAWFRGSKVVDENGKPLVVYSGHGNAHLYGKKFNQTKGSAGGFYATENPGMASGYALSKLGSKEYWMNGEQYRLTSPKTKELNKKIWQYELSAEQLARLEEMKKEVNEEGDSEWEISGMDRWIEQNKNYDKDARAMSYRGGSKNLHNIFKFFEYMGYNVAYPKEGQEAYFLRQQKNRFEELLDELGIKWSAYDWSEPGVMPVYLKIENPIDTSKPFPSDLLVALDNASKYEKTKSSEYLDRTHWTKDYPLKQWVKDIKQQEETGKETYWATQVPSKALPIIKSFGYDGIKDIGGKGGGQKHTIWIALSPTQIKSIFNRGTWDANKPDILLKMGEDQATLSPENLRNAADTTRYVYQFMRMAGAPQEVLDRIKVEAGPFIDLRGLNYEQSRDEWVASGGDPNNLFGAVTVYNTHAVVQLATNLGKLEQLELTSYHEWYHIAKRWMMTQADADAVSKFFPGEEGRNGEAESFARFARSRRIEGVKGDVSALHRLWMKLRRYLQIVANGLKGKGWTRPEDIFGKVYVGAYRPKFEGAGETALQSYAPTFYSQMQNILDKKLPGAGTAQQFRQMIKSWADKGEFKADEWKWSGVDEWLAGKEGKVTKQDILDFLKANEVQIREVTKNDQVIDESDNPATVRENDDGEWEVVNNQENKYIDGPFFTEREASDRATEWWQEEMRHGVASPRISATKFSQWQLPGGENYRELLLTLPAISKYKVVPHPKFEGWFAIQSNNGEYVKNAEGNATRWDTRERAEQIGLPVYDEESYRSTHWSEPNVLAHVRYNDRTGPNGEKVLFIEEVQSDWHQAGRKKGYGLLKEGKWELVDRDGVVAGVYDSKEEAESHKTERRIFVRKREDTMGVPPAPFSKTWHELALKRILRHAAENGYDRVAWTTGEQQAERYDLSKHIDRIEYIKYADGTYTIVPYKGRTSIEQLEKYQIKENEIEDYVGKEIAKKIIEHKGEDRSFEYVKEEVPFAGTLSGLDLKVGGEGMKGFYDKILPDYLNKYAKKWGARVEETKLQTGKIVRIPEDYSGPLRDRPDIDEPKYSTVHSLPVTESMRDSVMSQGQAMFRTDESNPILSAITSLQRPGQPRQLVSISELRDKVNMPYEEFDKALFQLSREGKVALHSRDFPSELSEAARAKLLKDERGTYYVGVVPKGETLLRAEDEEKGRAYNKRAISKYGLTTAPESIGYITREGKGIDSSGKKQGSRSEGRNIDHREIAQQSLGEDSVDGFTDNMHIFMYETGNIRVVNAKGELNIDIPISKGMPTPQQLKLVQNLSVGKTIVFDLSDRNGRSVASGEGNYGSFLNKLKDTIQVESEINKSVSSGNIPKQLEPLANFIKENQLTKEQFTDARYSRENPLYDAMRKLMDNAGLGVNKIWSDFGFNNLQEFYDKASRGGETFLRADPNEEAKAKAQAWIANAMKNPASEQAKAIKENEAYWEDKAIYKTIKNEIGKTVKRIDKNTKAGKSPWTVVERPNITWWSKIFGSPEWIFEKVDAAQRVFKASLNKVDNAHSNYNNFTGNDLHMAAMRTFSKERPTEYKKLEELIWKADRENTKYSPDQLKGMGFSEQAITAWNSYRAMMDNALDALMADWKKVVDYCAENNLPLPEVVTHIGGKQVRVDLKVAMAKMGELRGSYAPRNREFKRFMVVAKKQGENPEMQYRDTQFFADKLAKEYEAKGYDVLRTNKGKIPHANKTPEDVFLLAGKTLAMNDMINSSMQALSRDREYKLDDFGLKGFMRTHGPGDREFIVAGPTNKEMNTVMKSLGGRWWPDKEHGGQKAWHFSMAPEDMEYRITRALSLTAGMPMASESHLLFAHALATEIAGLIRGRGFRGHMLERKQFRVKESGTGQFYVYDRGKRIGGPYETENEAREAHEIGQEVWLGYDTNLLAATSRYLTSLSGGLAKRQMMGEMVQAVSGTDILPQDYDSYEAYLDAVQERRIDSKTQSETWDAVTTYMQEMARNEEFSDRVIGFVKSIAVLKYLGGRFGSAAVNLTALATSVPTSMHAYADIPLYKVPVLLGRAMNLYREFKWGNKSTLKPETLQIFNTIREKGWDEAQYTNEAIETLRGKFGTVYEKGSRFWMMPFAATEHLNRVSTITAAFLGIREQNPKMPFEDVLNLAKTVSDKAHGVYGKTTRPYLAQGSNPFAQVARMFYVFNKFNHNYLQLMKDIGFEKKDYVALTYAMFSQAVIGGAKALPIPGLGYVLYQVMAQILTSLGDDRPEEGEEKVYAWLEENLSETMSDFARYGLAGVAGVNIRSSLESNIFQNMPMTLPEIAGAPGNVLMDLYEGGRDIIKGDVYRGAERIMPAAIGGGMRAAREYQEGVTTKKNVPRFYRGEKIQPTFNETILKALTFNPEQISETKEKKWADVKLVEKYRTKKGEIYSRLRGYFADPPEKRNDEEYAAIMEDVREYNETIRRNKLNTIENIGLIDKNSIKTALRQKQ